jgi:hypothetical protein
MASILASQSAEMRAKGEAMIQQADKLLCESWNERMWSDGEPIDPTPTIDQAVNGGFPWLEIQCARCKAPSDDERAQQRQNTHWSHTRPATEVAYFAVCDFFNRAERASRRTRSRPTSFRMSWRSSPGGSLRASASSSTMSFSKSCIFPQRAVQVRGSRYHERKLSGIGKRKNPAGGSQRGFYSARCAAEDGAAKHYPKLLKEPCLHHGLQSQRGSLPPLQLVLRRNTRHFRRKIVSFFLSSFLQFQETHSDRLRGTLQSGAY